jgi:hypothetical protein
MEEKHINCVMKKKNDCENPNYTDFFFYFFVSNIPFSIKKKKESGISHP